MDGGWKNADREKIKLKKEKFQAKNEKGIFKTIDVKRMADGKKADREKMKINKEKFQAKNEKKNYKRGFLKR